MAERYMDGTLSDDDRRTLLREVSVVAEGLMREAAEAYIEEIAPDAAKGLKSVGSALSKLFGRASKILKTAFLAAALVLHGPAPMVADERVIFAQQVVAQQAFLQNFQADVVGGSQPPDGTLVSRAGMYGQAAWAVGQNTRRGVVIVGGATEERRVLGAEDGLNCTECPELADLGWQPRYSLPALGETPCRTNCRCHWEFRGGTRGRKSHHEGHEGGKPGKKPQGHWVTREGRHLFIAGPAHDEGHHDEHHRELDEHAKRIGAEHGQDVRVAHSNPRTPAEHAALDKAKAKGAHLIETTSGPKHTIHRDEDRTTHEVGGVVRSEVTRSAGGKHWERREPTNNPHDPDEAHVFKHKTREGAEAAAHRQASAEARQETDRKRVITKDPARHIEDHSAHDYDNSADWHTIRHRIISE